MRGFAKLVRALDETTSTLVQTSALEAFFCRAPDADRVWGLALLLGQGPKRVATLAELRDWAKSLTGTPEWLFEACYAETGDMAETIALILPEPVGKEEPTLAEAMRDLHSLEGMTPAQRREGIEAAWRRLDGEERILFNKLVTGGFRTRVSRGLTTRALAQVTGTDAAALAHRLTGDWDPAMTSFADLLEGPGQAARPYPFAGTLPVDDLIEDLGDPADWQAEWQCYGIRCQLLNRAGAFALWSQGEELLTDRFPDFAPLSKLLPSGTVLDGEVLAWDAAARRPLPYAALQSRLGRRNISKDIQRSTPVRFVAYDLLELGGQDLRPTPLVERRAALARLLTDVPNDLPIVPSLPLPFADWAALASLRQQARHHLAEGFVLKRRASPYLEGSGSGWRQWRAEPFLLVAVLLCAEAGAGRRDGPFGDLTFAVRDGGALVPIGKANAGLADAERAEMARWVLAHTLERFGPVRRVPPELVFDLAFDGIQASPRHKSGIALRSLRILRWRRDTPLEEIDTIQALRAHLAEAGGPAPLTPRDI